MEEEERWRADKKHHPDRPSKRSQVCHALQLIVHAQPWLGRPLGAAACPVGNPSASSAVQESRAVGPRPPWAPPRRASPGALQCFRTTSPACCRSWDRMSWSCETTQEALGRRDWSADQQA